MKVRAKKFSSGRRAIKVILRFEEEGEVKQEEFTIRYDQMSSRRSRELADMFKDISDEELEKLPEAEQLRYRRALAESLATLNIDSPDIVGDDDLPVKLTVEEFDEWDIWNLKKIRDAISKDTNPND